MSETMTPEVATKLRAPFPAGAIGKLPRVFCGACKQAAKERKPSCANHQKKKCGTCGNNITEAHLHLDYVGHAEITDRLLQADPYWFWEPFAMDPDGLPKLDSDGGLWIRLTVAGVTRIGYGDAEDKRGPAAMKERIGDALRNAAMRFGVGLDLWGASGEGVEDASGHETVGRGDGPAVKAVGRDDTTAKPAKAKDPVEAAKTAAEKLLNAKHQEQAQWWVDKIESNGDSALDVSDLVKTDERDVLGIEHEERLSLADLGTYVVTYSAKRGHGPRQGELAVAS